MVAPLDRVSCADLRAAARHRTARGIARLGGADAAAIAEGERIVAAGHRRGGWRNRAADCRRHAVPHVRLRALRQPALRRYDGRLWNHLRAMRGCCSTRLSQGDQDEHAAILHRDGRRRRHTAAALPRAHTARRWAYRSRCRRSRRPPRHSLTPPRESPPRSRPACSGHTSAARAKPAARPAGFGDAFAGRPPRSGPSAPPCPTGRAASADAPAGFTTTPSAVAPCRSARRRQSRRH